MIFDFNNDWLFCRQDGEPKTVTLPHDAMLADNVKARELKSDGKYYMKEKGTSKVNSQEYFMREAITVRHPEGRTKQSFVDKIRKIFRRK